MSLGLGRYFGGDREAFGRDQSRALVMGPEDSVVEKALERIGIPPFAPSQERVPLCVALSDMWSRREAVVVSLDRRILLDQGQLV